MIGEFVQSETAKVKGLCVIIDMRGIFMNLGNVIESKVNSLPSDLQIEVLNFVETLIAKKAKNNSKEKALAWETWAKSHREETAVILDDSREAIYAEDE